MSSGGGQDQVAVFAVSGQGEARVPNRRCAPPYHLRFGVWGLGFEVWGLGSGVWGQGSGVWGLGLGVWGLGSGVWGLGLGA